VAKRLNLALPYPAWPDLDRELFEAVHPRGDLFDLHHNAKLSDRTVYARRSTWGQFLQILLVHRPEQLAASPCLRVTVDNLRFATEVLKRNCSDNTVANFLQRIHLVVRAMYPDEDWRWIYTAQRRIQRQAIPLPHREVLSSEVYPIGLSLVEKAIAASRARGHAAVNDAEIFRDGLVILTLTEQAMRRGELAAIDINQHLEKNGTLWVISLPAELTKTHEAKRYELSERLSGHVDLYLEVYRPLFPNADGHSGMWPYKDRPMVDKMIRRYVRKHTQAALGFAVTPHRFRNAAATFTSVVDPANIRMAKGLLGHASLAMTEKHYVDGSRSRLAARSHAKAWQTLVDASKRQ